MSLWKTYYCESFVSNKLPHSLTKSNRSFSLLARIHTIIPEHRLFPCLPIQHATEHATELYQSGRHLQADKPCNSNHTAGIRLANLCMLLSCHNLPSKLGQHEGWIILVAHLLHIIGQSRLILFRTTISIHQNAEPKSWKCEKPLFFAGMKSYLSNHKFSIANCIYFKDILNTTTPPCPTGCAFRLLD